LGGRAFQASLTFDWEGEPFVLYGFSNQPSEKESKEQDNRHDRDPRSEAYGENNG
jgi:hypothetical protein